MAEGEESVGYTHKGEMVPVEGGEMPGRQGDASNERESGTERVGREEGQGARRRGKRGARKEWGAWVPRMQYEEAAQGQGEQWHRPRRWRGKERGGGTALVNAIGARVRGEGAEGRDRGEKAARRGDGSAGRETEAWEIAAGCWADGRGADGERREVWVAKSAEKLVTAGGLPGHRHCLTLAE
ncbi:hypothetical protein EDB86DRAFT_2832192 [Lactarius hatsudake]|nr:hypothetical protein EDB86DRAFT_2832192 [Lactarius hatsudake]